MNEGIGQIIKECGTWAVTTEGLVCHLNGYFIPKGELRQDWFQRIGFVDWLDPDDLLSGLIEASIYHNVNPPEMRLEPPAVSLSLRFRILKRDDYRCQICGRTAQDGVRLQVDHKLARSRGGTSHPDNLWTLCFDCNMGKRTESL